MKANMHRKDYQAIARIIYSMRSEQADRHLSATELLDQLAEDFADELAGTNPNFDRPRFIAACNTGSK